MLDLFLYISVIANIATIIALPVSVFYLRKDIKSVETKIDVLVSSSTKAGMIFNNSIINDLHSYGEVRFDG
jgi:hypothetical protein